MIPGLPPFPPTAFLVRAVSGDRVAQVWWGEHLAFPARPFPELERSWVEMIEAMLARTFGGEIPHDVEYEIIPDA